MAKSAVKTEVQEQEVVKEQPEKSNQPLTPEQTAQAAKEIGAEQINAERAAEKKEPTKSDLIRQMFRDGMTVGDIAKATNSHYSFVYGVCKSEMGGLSPSTKSGQPSKSDLIREMAAQGKTPGEIAKATNSNYSFVHSVVKKFKAEQEGAAQ